MADNDDLPPERVGRNRLLHRACEAGEYEACEKFLKAEEEEGADAWWQDPDMLGWSALHFAAEGGHTRLVKLLLRRGAIWNASDLLGKTAAEIAWSSNDERTYRAIFDEGVRQTLLLNLLERRAEDASHGPSTSRGGVLLDNGHLTLSSNADSSHEVSASNDAFLSSKLSFVEDPSTGTTRCLDVDGGLVMAPWETDIMALSVASLLDEDENTSDEKQVEKHEYSVLNVGFGLGIIDGIFQARQNPPTRHVIIDAHPDAIAYAKQLGWDKRPGVELIHAKWEDALEQLQGQDFDAIYWDTYAQGYAELRRFFEYLPDLLNGPQAKFSFFHGLAGTNPFLYDVYTRVAELDLKDIGLSTSWRTMRPTTTEETWQGVVRKYWQLDTINVPVAQMDTSLFQ